MKTLVRTISVMLRLAERVVRLTRPRATRSATSAVVNPVTATGSAPAGADGASDGGMRRGSERCGSVPVTRRR